MKLPSSAISIKQATTEGYRPLTNPYRLPGQREMLDNAQRDLEGVDFILVGNSTAPEIWRKNMMSMTESGAVKIPLEAR